MAPRSLSAGFALSSIITFTMPMTIMKLTAHRLALLAAVLFLPWSNTAQAEQPKSAQKPSQVKIAAVQISGYDKGDLPRKGDDVVARLLPYINRAQREGAELVVFPEYVLGHISVPGPETNALSAAAAASEIYVIVGCWEVIDDTNYANTALIVDRQGEIAGKYHKTHAAVLA